MHRYENEYDCPKCGHSWIAESDTADDDDSCPKCGTTSQPAESVDCTDWGHWERVLIAAQVGYELSDTDDGPPWVNVRFDFGSTSGTLDGRLEDVAPVVAQLHAVNLARGLAS